jgi:hypothetical protein
MKLTPWYFAALAPLAVAGCSGAFLGQFAVLALTVGIFVGTLMLGRRAQQPEARQDASGQVQIEPSERA